MKKSSFGNRLLKIVLAVFILSFSIAPLYACVLVSLTPYSHMLTPQLVPHYFELANYSDAFKGVATPMLNSMLYSCGTIILVLLTCIPIAYICARYEFRVKKTITFGLLVTQMISGIVLLPSLYSIYNEVGALNNRFVLIFTFTGVNMGLTVWLLMGFFQDLPSAIEEAAYIDGANFVKVLLYIIIPISIPGIAVAAIFAFINSYNEFMIPLFLITSPEYKTLTLRLYSYMSDTTVMWNIVAAGALIGMAPVVIVFLFCQEYIIGGVTSGAVKS